MPYRPRELVIRAREAAFFLLATLDRDEMVQRFLDMYSAEFRRPGRADQPVHYREQLQTIRREALHSHDFHAIFRMNPVKLQEGIKQSIEVFVRVQR